VLQGTADDVVREELQQRVVAAYRAAGGHLELAVSAPCCDVAVVRSVLTEGWGVACEKAKGSMSVRSVSRAWASPRPRLNIATTSTVVRVPRNSVDLDGLFEKSAVSTGRIHGGVALTATGQS
jgi:hypothetical protein